MWWLRRVDPVRRLLVELSVLMLLLISQMANAPVSSGEPELGVSPLAADYTVDELLDIVAGEVPEFGGVYSGGPTSLNILIVGGSPTAASKAHVSLAKWLSPAYASKTIKVLPATYSFRQLKDWNDKVTSAIWSIDGVTTNFIEDKKNSLTLAYPV